MSIFSKKKEKKPKDDSFQAERPSGFVTPKSTVQSPFDAISPYHNELLLRGKIGMSTGVPEKKPTETDIIDNKSDTINLEPETEYAQVMKINIDQKFNESME